MSRTQRENKDAVTENAPTAETTKLQSKQSTLKNVRDNMRDITYDSDDMLAIPEDTRLRMESEGFELRWIRARVSGETYIRNLRKRNNQGYTWVTIDEVPEMTGGLSGVANGPSEDDLVIIDDLILAKISIERADNIRNKNVYEAQKQDEAIRVSLSEKEIHNRSVSSSLSGKKSAFATEKE